jgi:hypothetical protein
MAAQFKLLRIGLVGAILGVFCPSLRAESISALGLDERDLRLSPDWAEPAKRPPLFGFSGMSTDGEQHSMFPLMAKEARAAGYELPQPFGVAGIYNYLQRDIKITDLRIGVNGGALRSVSQFVNLGSTSHVDVGLGKLDMYLFPFLNVYTLLGYIHNESTTNGVVTVPNPGPGGGSTTFPFTANTTIDGFVGGFGLTVGGGYKQFFAALDTNWTATNLGFDDKFRAVVVSLRTGWNGKIHDVPVRIWTGAAYWDTANTASSTVTVPGLGNVAFEADQGPEQPWNMVLGTQITIKKRFDLFMEYGTDYDTMKYFATGLSFRF